MKPFLKWLWQNSLYIIGCTVVGFAVFAPDGTRDFYNSVRLRQAFLRDNGQFREAKVYRYIRWHFPVSTPEKIKTSNRVVMDQGSPARPENWPLAIAASEYPVLTQYLVQNGANVNERGKFGFTALHYVHTYGACKALIDAGANVNALGGFNMTPLDVVSTEDPDVMDLLLDKGARKCRDTWKTSPDYSSHLFPREYPDLEPQDTPEFLKYLKQLQSDPQANRLLSHEETMRLLVERHLPAGGAVAADDRYSQMHFDNTRLYKVLLEHVDDLAPFEKGREAIVMRLCKRLIPQLENNQLVGSVVALAVKKGSNVNYINPDDGCTALHYAVRNHCHSAVKALLANGADPNIKNKAGLKPADLNSGIEELLR